MQVAVWLSKDSRRASTQVNKAAELSLKCDCTLQCTSSDVGDIVALLDC